MAKKAKILVGKFKGQIMPIVGYTTYRYGHCFPNRQPEMSYIYVKNENAHGRGNKKNLCYRFIELEILEDKKKQVVKTVTHEEGDNLYAVVDPENPDYAELGDTFDAAEEHAQGSLTENVDPEYEENGGTKSIYIYKLYRIVKATVRKSTSLEFETKEI